MQDSWQDASVVVTPCDESPLRESPRDCPWDCPDLEIRTVSQQAKFRIVIT